MILGPLAKHKATIWRHKKRRGRGGPAEAEQLLDESGGPTFTRGRFAAGGRRIYETGGARTLGDARFTYRIARPHTIQENDLIRHEAPDGGTYKVLRIDKATGIASRFTYHLVTLEATEEILPQTHPATETVGA